MDVDREEKHLLQKSTFHPILNPEFGIDDVLWPLSDYPVDIAKLLGRSMTLAIDYLNKVSPKRNYKITALNELHKIFL